MRFHHPLRRSFSIPRPGKLCGPIQPPIALSSIYLPLRPPKRHPVLIYRRNSLSIISV
ncbi:hypothetical protein BJ165DRAFT_1515387 [Panaeolus papilionaceus]|nr:hypothetical protein BJ165DRAFT_1515387 [Panaeolus papilionaceus]